MMAVQDWLLAVLGLYFVQTLLGPTLRYLSAGKGGIGRALGPRDTPPPMPVIGGRLARALENMQEALFVFLPVALLLIVREAEAAGAATGAATGAAVFFWARLAFVPAYVSGVPGLRTAVWTVGHAGIGMMVLALLRAA